MLQQYRLQQHAWRLGGLRPTSRTAVRAGACADPRPDGPSTPGAPAGQGDPPDNMRGLWRFLLRKSLPPDSLGGLRAAVFGLGDSG